MRFPQFLLSMCPRPWTKQLEDSLGLTEVPLQIQLKICTPTMAMPVRGLDLMVGRNEIVTQLAHKLDLPGQRVLIWGDQGVVSSQPSAPSQGALHLNFSLLYFSFPSLGIAGQGHRGSPGCAKEIQANCYNSFSFIINFFVIIIIFFFFFLFFFFFCSSSSSSLLLLFVQL